MGKRMKVNRKGTFAPRRPMSAFLFYNIERKEALKKAKPELNNKELIILLGKEWNELNGKQRKPYIEMAKRDKERYKKEVEEYEQKKVIIIVRDNGKNNSNKFD